MKVEQSGKLWTARGYVFKHEIMVIADSADQAREKFERTSAKIIADYANRKVEPLLVDEPLPRRRRK